MDRKVAFTLPLVADKDLGFMSAVGGVSRASCPYFVANLFFPLVSWGVYTGQKGVGNQHIHASDFLINYFSECSEC